MCRKVDTSTDNPDVDVREARVAFNVHMDVCRDCQPVMCATAQHLWRNVCVLALHARSGDRAAF